MGEHRRALKSGQSAIKKFKITTQNVNLASTTKNAEWKRNERASTLYLDPANPEKAYRDHRKPEEKRKKQMTRIFMTINFNKSGKDPNDAELLTRAMHKMLDQLSVWRDVNAPYGVARYLQFGPKHEEYRQDKYSAVITDVQWDAAVETGQIKERVHAHVIIEIQHYSQVRIDKDMLQYHARQAYEEAITSIAPGRSELAPHLLPFVYLKLLPEGNWTEMVRDYIHKASAPV